LRREISILLITGFLIGLGGCTTKDLGEELSNIVTLGQYEVWVAGPQREKEARERQERLTEQHEQQVSGIYEGAKQRGYVTVEELKTIMDYRIYYLRPAAAQVLQKLVNEDLLPFNAMFYLALEKEKYDEAEIIRRQWIASLEEIENIYDKEFGEGKDLRVEYQLEKLTSVIGLTDPMLVTLRKELVTALKAKQWDDAQKIQNLVVSRTNELRPPQPQQAVGSSSHTTVVVQQPSVQHLKVENVPRYGAEDVGRAMSLISGQGGNLTDQETGTLKMFDIIMGR
jgi:hypothetical protein